MTQNFTFNIPEKVKSLFPDISDEWITIYNDVEIIAFHLEEKLNFKSLIVAGLCRVLGEYIKKQLCFDKDIGKGFDKLGKGVWGGTFQKHSKRKNLYLPNDPKEANEIWVNWNNDTKQLLEKIKCEYTIRHSIPLTTNTNKFIRNVENYENEQFDIEHLKKQLVDKLDYYSD